MLGLDPGIHDSQTFDLYRCWTRPDPVGIPMLERQPFDVESYVRRTQIGTCFICEMLRDNPEYHHHRIYEDGEDVIFLSKYPTQPGYCLVCPKAHHIDIAEDLSSDAYLRLQSKVHQLSRALKKIFDAERIYVLSLGSNQGNAHLHWHVVPLPRNTPYDKQQYHALMAENGVLRFSEAELCDMADKIKRAFVPVSE